MAERPSDRAIAQAFTIESECRDLDDVRASAFVGHVISRARTLDAAQPAGEAVAWLHEDTLPKGYPYDAMFPYSRVDGVRMFPVFGPPVASQAVAVPGNLALGETIFTPPGEEVKFCYSRGQPDNGNAWRLGEACSRAALSPGGDFIDAGLSLLKELEARGYGVFRFVKDAPIASQAVAGAVPDGFAIVPKEPTDAMLAAAFDADCKAQGFATGNDARRAIYLAMLASAPQPPDADKGEAR